MAGITGSQRFLEIDTTAEAVPGIPNAVQTLDYPEMASDGFGIGEGAEFDEIQVEANTTTQPAPTLGGFAPTGPLEIIPAPYDASAGPANKSWMRFLLDWAVVRTSGSLAAHTVVGYYPLSASEFARRFSGSKVDQITIGWDRNNKLQNPKLTTRSQYAEPFLAVGIVPTPTFPSYRHWNFTYLGVQQGSGYSMPGTKTIEKEIRAVQIAYNNRLQPGPSGYKYDSTDALVKGLQSLDEQQAAVTGSFEILMKSWNIISRFVAQTASHLRILGFHPNSPRGFQQDASLSTNPTSATVDVALDTGEGTNFDVGDHVYWEDHTDPDPLNWLREVLYVSAKAGDVLTLMLQGQDPLKESIGRTHTFTAGSILYKYGIQFLCRSLKYRDWKTVGGAADKLYQRVEFSAYPWIGLHPTEGASYAHPAFSYMVR